MGHGTTPGLAHWHEEGDCFPPTLTCRKGTMPSREMACSRRGAPVRLWSPAPQVEKKEPMTMTQGEGQASVPTTKLPFTASPNLE